jgi:DNA-directed RNA polymerase specialized sigma24 family protein
MSDSAVDDDVQAPGKHLSPEEVLEKLESLSADDKLRLRLLERRRLGGTDLKEGELYHETVCLVLLGDRRCPCGESIVAFVAQTMRSIASHRRTKLKRFEPMTGTDHDGVPVELQAASDDHNPERSLIEQEDTDIVSAIYECLEGDDEAQLVIMEIVAGKKGKELRDGLGIDQPTYDYAMRRIKKAVTRKYPKGWSS